MKPKSKRNFLGAALLLAVLAATSACGSGSDAPPPPEARPALTDEKIRDTIYQAWVQEVPEETGASEPVSWRFRRDEPLELTIVEKQMDGDKATVVVDVTTQSAPRSRRHMVLSGRIRLHYELETELILRRWEVVDVDNLSMKYRDEPRTDAAPDGGAGAPAPPPPPPVEPRKGS